MFLTHFSIGGRRFDSPNFFLETQLNHIINSVFSEWVRHIQLAVKAVFQLSLDAQYITFNYTDTLEVQVEMTQDHFSDDLGEITDMEKSLVSALKAMLGIYAKVRLVAPKSITRSEGKAVRVIDKRKI